MKRTTIVGIFMSLLCAGLASCSSSDNATTTAPAGGNVAGNTPEAEADTARAADLVKNGSLDKAKELLQRAIVADPMYGPAHNDLGLVYAKQEEIYSAAIEYRDAIKLMPRQPQPLNNLGLVLESAGKFREAEQYYTEASAIDPDNMEFTGNLARTRVRLGETGKPLTDLLAKIVLYDSRPEWTQWAQRMLMKQSTPTTLPLNLP